MMNKSKLSKRLGLIIDEIKKEYQPERIILFGSYAYGQPDRDSDIDFLVIIKQPLDWSEIYELRRKLSRNIPIPVQIITMTTTEFMETKDVIGGIAYPASKYGEMVYEKS